METGGASQADAALITLDEEQPRRSRRGRVLGAVAAVAVAGAAVGVTVAMSSSEPRTADEALAGAHAFLADTPSFRYQADLSETYGSPTDDGPGSFSSHRTVVQGDVASGTEWRVTSDSGDWADETIRVGETVWTRSAESSAGLDDETWMEFPFDGPGERGFAELPFSPGGYLPTMGDGLEDFEGEPYFAVQGMSQDPASTVDLIRGAVATEVLARPAGGVTLRLDPDLGDDGSAPESFSIELDLDADDVPTALRISAELDEEEIAGEITFRDWGADIAVSPPAAEDVDATPWIDEEALLAYTASGVYAPTYLPEGWSITGLEAYGEDESLTGCEELNLSYGTPMELPEGLGEVMDGMGSGEELPFDEMEAWMESFTFSGVQLSLVDAACGAGSETDEGLFGSVDIPGMDHQRSEVQLGDTLVWVDAMNVDPAELDAIVASLQPADLISLVGAVAALEDPWSSGFFGF